MSGENTMNKKVYFEMMRIIACGLVIFNHLNGYSLYGGSHGGKQFFYMCLTMDNAHKCSFIFHDQWGAFI